MPVVLVVTDGDLEYTTSLHPSDEMMWCIPHHSVRGKAATLTATECYGNLYLCQKKQKVAELS